MKLQERKAITQLQIKRCPNIPAYEKLMQRLLSEDMECFNYAISITNAFNDHSSVQAFLSKSIIEKACASNALDELDLNNANPKLIDRIAAEGVAGINTVVGSTSGSHVYTSSKHSALNITEWTSDYMLENLSSPGAELKMWVAWIKSTKNGDLIQKIKPLENEILLMQAQSTVTSEAVLKRGINSVISELFK